MRRRPPRSTLFPYTTLCRSEREEQPPHEDHVGEQRRERPGGGQHHRPDRARDDRDRRRSEARADVGQTLEEDARSEEHTSELQSRQYLVCRLLLEKKKFPH